ncbi:hypothetical protein O3S80_04170 [Streptomyces sp. Lzd4kr]|nr:hypothetical protein [Streptomyces sp. Lzd4kr]
MIARAVNAAADVIHRAQVNGTQTATGIAIALESAQLLQSPETAAEVALSADAVRVAEESLAELRREHEENARLRARIAELDAQREALAERLRAGQQWQRGRRPELVSEDFVSQPELRSIFGIQLAAPWADGITQLIAPSQVLREVPDGEHAAWVHHDHRVGRDLPGLGGA